jgi:sec-independent protein translocase protein TatA
VIGDILQPTHLLLILLVALLVLGPKRLPEAGRSLGRGLRDFKSALNFDEPEQRDHYVQTAVDAPVQPAPAPPVQSAPAPPVQPAPPAAPTPPTEPVGPAS